MPGHASERGALVMYISIGVAQRLGEELTEALIDCASIVTSVWCVAIGTLKLLRLMIREEFDTDAARTG